MTNSSASRHAPAQPHKAAKKGTAKSQRTRPDGRFAGRALALATAMIILVTPGISQAHNTRISETPVEESLAALAHGDLPAGSDPVESPGDSTGPQLGTDGNPRDSDADTNADADADETLSTDEEPGPVETPPAVETPGNDEQPLDTDAATETIFPRAAPNGNYCTSGIFTLRRSPAPTANTVYAVSSSRSITTTGSTGAFSGAIAPFDALAISPSGTAAFAATAPAAGTVSIHRLDAGGNTSSAVVSNQPTRAGLTSITSGAINARGTHYIFGGFTRESGVTRFETFAYNIATNSYIGQIGRIPLPASVGSAGVGDLVFDAQDQLFLLWSPTGGGPSSVHRVGSGITLTASTTRVIPVAASVGIAVDGSYNGLAFDGAATLHLQGVSASGTDTLISKLNPATGTISGTVTTPSFVGADLASCGYSTVNVETDVVDRYFPSDQFTFDIRSAGSTTSLASATTSGSIPGTGGIVAGPVVATPGSVFTIGAAGGGGAPASQTTRALTGVAGFTTIASSFPQIRHSRSIP